MHDDVKGYLQHLASTTDTTVDLLWRIERNTRRALNDPHVREYLHWRLVRIAGLALRAIQELDEGK